MTNEDYKKLRIKKSGMTQEPKKLTDEKIYFGMCCEICRGNKKHDECISCQCKGHTPKEPIGVSELNIGLLRQWLNEDRITDPKKMVTNEQIKEWLEIKWPEK